MPALPPVPGVLKVVLNGFIDNLDVQNWANVLHFRYNGAQPSSSDCQVIALNIGGAWGATVASLCPSPTTLSNVAVTDLTSDTAGEGIAVINHAGSRGDDSIPANAAVLISYKAPMRWRGGHPRTYIYALGNADLQGAGQWSTAATAEVLAHWQNFINGCQAITVGGSSLGTLCCVRYVSSAVNPIPPHRLTAPIVLSLNINNAVAAQQMASQRGRIGRTPRNA
jgi:hypothetical protein